MTPDQVQQRRMAPVFVLGCPRSGTTLLYDMLLSAGGFAVYLAESNVFNVLALRFGDLGSRSNRQELLRTWLDSKLFRATGLDAQQIEKKLLDECLNAGDFLRIVMDEVARSQGMQRWAENSPETLLHLPLIKALIPHALVVHIIRDGRDVATSLERVRYVRPFPWEERQNLIGSGLYWEWIVQHGRRYGKMLGPDYMEIHFEALLSSPQDTLNQIGRFIDHELDYQRIREVAYGSVASPNTSFKAETPGTTFNPVGRWKSSFSPQQLERFERMTGPTLRDLGYNPVSVRASDGMTAGQRATRLIYRSYFGGKLWFKKNRLLRALRPTLTSSEIDATCLGEDGPPVVRNIMSRS